MHTCLFCERRFRLRPDGERMRCFQCKRAQEARRAQEAKDRLCWRKGLYRVLRYRGHLVGLYERPGGEYHPSPLAVAVASVPKGITLNLDTYLDGFTREQVKKMKATVKRLWKMA